MQLFHMLATSSVRGEAGVYLQQFSRYIDTKRRTQALCSFKQEKKDSICSLTEEYFEWNKITHYSLVNTLSLSIVKHCP